MDERDCEGRGGHLKQYLSLSDMHGWSDIRGEEKKKKKKGKKIGLLLKVEEDWT